ncbi:cell division protein FtsQ/DivIB [Cognatishimia activa]|uniref:Cell division protein FtsQ n=1 Tax=Cognatishimia activa TaxID=1715691 RepID=A0A0P1IU75_9RHOB|nr:cell division protein FtsQ/DivIB [Cognatishimia activa]MEE2945045.1 cell division protein FtsQ/DivIB [Pseudomonadota bacterium]CUJ20243.1 Cell division protein FtsQ [Cognatishimia activa]CUK25507.1 Cell division protein FtsQ [Cognatishimia activa]
MRSIRAVREKPKAEKQRCEPAPSRLSYRYERLMLTPVFRFGVRIVLPFAVAALGTTIWFSDQDHRDQVNMAIDDLRTSIVERPEFLVKAMSIEGASPSVADDIREILPVDFPVSSFDLDIDAMKMTVDGLSPVKSSSLRVKPGGVLQVNVVERNPVILWRMNDGLHLVDAEGYVVAESTQRDLHPNLPIMAGEGADTQTTEALQLMQAAGPLRERMRGLVRVGERRWDLVLDRDQRIMLPEWGAVQALERVVALSQVQEMLQRDLSVVDMRLGDRPTIRIAKRSVEAWWRIRDIRVGQE